MGMAVAAGAALAPDLDEHQSLGGRGQPHLGPAHVWWPPDPDPTLLAAAVVLGLALLCQRDRTAMAVFVGFMARTGGSVALATVRRAGCFLSVPLGALAGYVSHSYLSAGWWTDRGGGPPVLEPPDGGRRNCRRSPLLMPFTKHRFSLGLIKTWHLTERVIFTPLILATLSVATWGALGPSTGPFGVPGLPRLLS